MSRLLPEPIRRRGEEGLQAPLVVDLEEAFGVGKGGRRGFIHGVEDELGIVLFCGVREEVVQRLLHALVESLRDLVALDVGHVELEGQTRHFPVDVHVRAFRHEEFSVGGQSRLLHLREILVEVGDLITFAGAVRQPGERHAENGRTGEADLLHFAELIHRHPMYQFLICLMDPVEVDLSIPDRGVVGVEVFVGVLLEREGQHRHRNREPQGLGKSGVPHENVPLDLFRAVGGQTESQQKTLGFLCREGGG